MGRFEVPAGVPRRWHCRRRVRLLAAVASRGLQALVLLVAVGALTFGSAFRARADEASVASDVLGQLSRAGAPVFDQGTSSADPSSSQSWLNGNAAVDSVNHRLFVSDGSHSRVLVYDLDSSDHLTSSFADHVLGQPDMLSSSRHCRSSATQSGLCAPFGLAYDAGSSRLFVVDGNGNNRVLVYDLSSGISDGMNASYVLGQPNFTTAPSLCSLSASTLCQPTDVAYDATHHRLLVSDSSDNRVIVYDLSSGITNGMSASYVLGQSGFTSSSCDSGGVSAATLCDPLQLAYDSSGDRLFVADHGTGSSTLENSRVLEYSFGSGISSGMSASHVLGQSSLTAHGCNTGGRSAQSLCDPAGVAYDAGSSTLFVADTGGGNERVLSYDLSGGVSNGMAASHVLGQPDFTTATSPACSDGSNPDNSSLCDPEGLAYDASSGQLFVDDFTNGRQLIFDLSGGISDGMDFSSVLGGQTARNMSYPQATLIDPVHHRLFVGNCGIGYGRVLEFDLNDQNVLVDHTADHVLGQSSFTTSSLATAQNTLGECIVGLAYDPDHGRLFISDEDNNRVLVYDLSSGISDGMNASYVLGEPDFTSGADGSSCWWNGGGPTSSNLCQPYGGLSFDPSSNYLYVGDGANSRVLVYDLSSGISDGMAASYVLGQANFTSFATATTQNRFSGGPRGMALDTAGHRLFVGDWGSAARVLIWDTSSLSNGMNASHELGESDFTSADSAADFGDTPDASSFIPSGLAYDSVHQRLFVADSDTNGSNPAYRVLMFEVATISDGEDASGVLGLPDFTSTNASWDCEASQHTLCDPEGTDDYYDPTHDRLYVSDSGNQRVLAFTVPGFTGPAYGKAPASWTRGLKNDSAPGLACPCAGDPIATATGDFSEATTDASVATFGPPLAFTRTYDASLAQTEAAASTPGPLGYGWTDNWHVSLSLNDPVTGAVTVHQANGAEVSFYPPSSGSCTAPYVGSGAAGTYCALPDVTASLTYDSSTTTYTFVTHPYMSYAFDSSGTLAGESVAGGAAVTIAHGSPSPGSGPCPSAAASCNTITSASGRALVIAENGSGEVTKVIDPLGNTWTYTYCSPPSSTCSADDLVSVTDPLSNVTSYTYDQSNATAALKHDLLTITNPNGQPGGPDAGAKTVNTYNAAGQVTAQTDPAGNETSFDYSELDTATGDGATVVTDPDGNQTQFSYIDGVLVSKVEGYGTDAASTWIYEPDSTTLLDDEVIDPNGDTTSYTYDAAGNTTSVTNALGGTVTYSYNGFDEKTCTTLPLAASECASLSPPAAITAGTSTITPPSSAPPKYVSYGEYDTDGNPIWTTSGDYNPGSSSASQSRTAYQLYDGQSVTLGSNTDSCAASPPATSLPCLTIDPNGVVTQLGYDTSTGDLLSTSTPDGNTGGEVAETTYSYDGDGLLHTVTAPDGNLSGASSADYTTTNGYDDDGELTSVTVSHAAGSITARTTSYVYDGDGNRTSVTDPRNKETDYGYDGNDRLTLVTDADNQQTLTCYDGDNDVTEVVPPVGVAANSLTAASCPSSYPSGYGDRLADDATTYAYDALGDRTTITTPAPAGLSGHVTTTNGYDAAGQLTSVIAPAASNSGGAPDRVTTYSYDPAGELLVVTKGDGTSTASTTSYCYDPNGEKTAVVAPDGNTSSIATCASSSPYQTSSAYQTGYSYDSLGELVSETRPATAWATSGQTTSYTYDPAGNQLTSEDANGVTTTNSYTPLNQLSTVSYSGSSAPSVSYLYDANGNRLTMTDGTGTSSYVYDPFNEVTSYENGNSQTVRYGYNDDGQISSVTYPLGSGATWASSDTVSYGHDNAGELNSITDFNGNMITIGNTADGLPNSVALGSSGDTISTSYDPTDTPSQITLGTGTSTLLQFAYSDVPSGAIDSETDTPSWSGSPATYSYDAQNRVTQMTPGAGSSLSYGFDASGNLTTLPTGASGSYDDASELTSSTLSGTTTSYTYDADGERTQAAVGGSTTVSASYNGAQQLTSYSNAAANMSSASYDGDGLRASATATPNGGSAATQDFTWDPTGSVPHLLIDSDNAYIYGPGNTPIEQVVLATGTIHYLASDLLASVRGVVSSSGSLTASTAYDAWGTPETGGGLTSYTPFGYAGGYTDPNGLIYFIGRYYDPQAGQFLTVDPLVDDTGAAYAYVAGNPVTNRDPTGLLPDCQSSDSAGSGGRFYSSKLESFSQGRADPGISVHDVWARDQKSLAALIANYKDPLGTYTRVSVAFSYLEVRGFTAAEAAGIVGNLWHESSAYLSPGDPGLVPWVDYCNGCAYGLAQWDPARQKQLREHEGEKADTFGGQLEFVYYDLAQSQRYNQTYGAILGDTHDVYKATLDFMNGYEGPGSPEFPDRLQKARTICARYGGC